MKKIIISVLSIFLGILILAGCQTINPKINKTLNFKPKTKIIKYSFIKPISNQKKLNLKILNLISLTKFSYYNFNKIDKKEVAKLIVEKSKHYKYLDTKIMKVIFLNKKYTRKDLKDLYTTLKIKGLK